MAAALPFLQIAGTVMSVVGTLSAASSASAASRYNAALARNNAIIADQNATLARQQAVAQSEQQRRDAARRIGSMKAGYANSGLTMEGTPLDVIGASAEMAELDTLNIIYNGELKARSYSNEAEGYRNTATLDRMRAKNQETQGMYSAGSSLLLGASRYASTYGGSNSSSGLYSENSFDDGSMWRAINR